MNEIRTVAKVFLLILLGSLFLPEGAAWFTALIDKYSNSVGAFVMLALLLLVLDEDNILGEGSKGITKEYVSESGKKRTAKKIREEHIV